MAEFGLADEYHFRRDSRLVSYLGAGLGWHSSHFGKIEELALAYGPRAGLKVFIADNVALDFELTYKLASGGRLHQRLRGGGHGRIVRHWVARDVLSRQAIVRRTEQ